VLLIDGRGPPGRGEFRVDTKLAPSLPPPAAWRVGRHVNRSGSIATSAAQPRGRRRAALYAAGCCARRRKRSATRLRRCTPRSKATAAGSSPSKSWSLSRRRRVKASQWNVQRRMVHERGGSSAGPAPPPWTSAHGPPPPAAPACAGLRRRGRRGQRGPVRRGGRASGPRSRGERRWSQRWAGIHGPTNNAVRKRTPIATTAANIHQVTAPSRRRAKRRPHSGHVTGPPRRRTRYEAWRPQRGQRSRTGGFHRSQVSHCGIAGR
jgi:hypothetical protein